MCKPQYWLEEVQTPAQIRAWLDFPKHLYADYPNWICPLDTDVEEVFDPQRNELFADGEAIRWVVRDADDRIRLAMNTEKTQRMVEIFHDLNTQKVCHVAETNAHPQMTMETGRLLFFMNGPDELERLRDCEVEFGFVPYPKWDEAQKEYHSMDFGGLMCVPTTITDPEMVGTVLELLAWDSDNNVVPTYYNTLLEGKFAQDETAASMLRLIFDSICYEVGGNYFGFSGGFNNLFYAVSNVAFRNNSSDFASFYAKNEKSANMTIEKFYEALDEVENN